MNRTEFPYKKGILLGFKEFYVRIPLNVSYCMSNGENKKEIDLYNVCKKNYRIVLVRRVFDSFYLEMRKNK